MRVGRLLAVGTAVLSGCCQLEIRGFDGDSGPKSDGPPLACGVALEDGGPCVLNQDCPADYYCENSATACPGDSGVYRLAGTCLNRVANPSCCRNGLDCGEDGICREPSTDPYTTLGQLCSVEYPCTDGSCMGDVGCPPPNGCPAGYHSFELPHLCLTQVCVGNSNSCPP